MSSYNPPYYTWKEERLHRSDEGFMEGERLWIPGIKESKPKRSGLKIGKNASGLFEEQRELSLAGGNEGET